MRPICPFLFFILCVIFVNSATYGLKISIKKEIKHRGVGLGGHRPRLAKKNFIIKCCGKSRCRDQFSKTKKFHRSKTVVGKSTLNLLLGGSDPARDRKAIFLFTRTSQIKNATSGATVDYEEEVAPSAPDLGTKGLEKITPSLENESPGNEPTAKSEIPETKPAGNDVSTAPPKNPETSEVAQSSLAQKPISSEAATFAPQDSPLILTTLAKTTELILPATAPASTNSATSETAAFLIISNIMTVTAAPSQETSLTTSILPSTTTSTSSTTTSTMPELCKSPSCKLYNDANISTLQNMIPPAGKYFFARSKMLFFSETKMPLADAIKNCLRLGLKIMSFGEKEALEKMKALLSISKTFKGKLLEFWTSGTNMGEFCDIEKKYSWCDSPKVLLESELGPLMVAPNITSADRCLTLKYDVARNGLFHQSCSAQANLMCEPSCDAVTCPSVSAADPNLFENDVIKSSEKLGFWAQTCGTTYLFSNSIGTWKQNWEKCCSLGMKPIAFETTDEFKCLSNFTKDKWKYNFNYWTGGTQQGCKGSWGWCAGSMSPLPENLTWALNQPDNKVGNEDCLQMRLLQNASGLVLSDRNCSDKFVIACEGTPTLKTCLTAYCPNASKFKPSGELIDVFSYGSWATRCGRHFLFSKTKTTWANASRACASIGMTHLAVEYKAKHQCLSNGSLKIVDIFENRSFWTSGTDQDCDGQYKWCSLGRDFISSEVNWAAGQPKSAGGDCVVINVSNTTANLTNYSTAKCDELNHYICEVRKAGTAGAALQNECVEVWNISAADLAQFDKTSYNVSMMPLSWKFPFSSAMVRLLEEVTADDDAKLQNGLNAYDGCGGKKYEDECEAAAQMYQCGFEKEPGIVGQMYTKAAGNSTVYSTPVSCFGYPNRQCRLTNLPCVADPALISILNSNGSTGNGTIKTYNGKRFFESTRLPRTNSFMYQYCCSLGMKLAEFDDLATFQALPDWGDVAVRIQETYASADGEERWCGSGKIIPKTLFYPPSIYPPCNAINCILRYTTVLSDWTKCDPEAIWAYFYCSD